MNVELQDFIATAPAALLAETRLPGLPTGADPDDRWRSQLRASAAFKNRPVADQKSIFADLERHFYRFDDFCRTPVMSVDDVCQIAAVHEVGAHSFEHATMEFETNDYLREDLRRCRDYFKSRLALEPSVYAFPHGGARRDQTRNCARRQFRPHSPGWRRIFLLLAVATSPIRDVCSVVRSGASASLRVV
jgi:peptidoglycan/xylan/chitin deacetylase (PgdA/CDA1 family)